MPKLRRLFVGDLHGCLEELDLLLEAFGFRPGTDRLASLGDVMGKGPFVPGTLRRLRDLGALMVAGNHDLAFLQAWNHAHGERSRKQNDYIDSLGAEAEEWASFISTWPAYRDLGDIVMVHAGLEPGKRELSEMSPAVLTQIRTWDGKGLDLNRAGDPPWFECVDLDRLVVFGHWAKRGLIDLPKFKGLDTGCVYGGKLTGWCPEENRFLQVPAKRAYASIHRH